MKKIIGVIVVVIVIILGIVIVTEWAAVPSMLSSTLSKKLGVPCSVGSVTLFPSNIGIGNVNIYNPKGSILSKAYSSRKIDIGAPLTRYLNDAIVIDEIEISDVYLGLEFDSPTGTSGNWTSMMTRLKSSQGSAPSNEKARTVLIKKLVLTNISVELVYHTGDKKVKKLKTIDRLEFTNISSEKGLPTEQIMNSVLGQMLKSVFEKENLKNLMNTLLEQVPSPAQPFLQPFKGLFSP